MKRTTERRIATSLWILYPVFSLMGLAILAEALFVPRLPPRFELTGLPPRSIPSTLPVLQTQEGLAGRSMTRRVQGDAVPGPGKAVAITIESLIRLTGIMDFGGKRPSLAVIETLAGNESKAYQTGDKVGDTGVRVQEIGETVIVEFESRRYKLTPTGIQELPARALGTTGSERSGD